MRVRPGPTRRHTPPARHCLRRRVSLEAVLNLPSVREVVALNRVARLIRTKVVPKVKRNIGYTHERNKFETAGLTPITSDTVAAPRALECPVQLEVVLVAKHNLNGDDPTAAGSIGI